MTRLEAALDYAAKGIPIIPLCWPTSKGACGCGRDHDKRDIGKAPLTPSGIKDATTDPSAIRDWWSRWPEANIAIALAPVALVDVAPDSPQWETEFRRQGIPQGAAAFASGGGDGHQHFLMRRPEECPVHRLCRTGEYDILTNGYAVAPPSLHRSGRNYGWVTPLEDIESLPNAPQWVVEMLREAIQPSRTPPRAAKDTDGVPPVRLGQYGLAWWQGEKVKETPDGDIDRSATLFTIGLVLADAGATEDTIATALAERDEALGFDKYVERRDGGETEYYRIASKVISAADEGTSGNDGPARHEAVDSTDSGAAKKEVAARVGSAHIDPGLTKRLADEILETDHFAQDAGGKLYLFAQGVYKPVGKPQIRRRVKDLLNEWGLAKKWSTHRTQQVVEYIRTDAPTLWERPPFDTINLLNGLLNVATRGLLPHSPEFLSPVQLPVAYDPDAECPAWEKFVSETFPIDAVGAGVPWEILAWLMTPDTSIQKAVLLLGEGANGKSTFLSALATFIGGNNVVGLSLQKLEAERFSAARLVGKLANICPDLPSTHLASTSMFKALTGGDSIAGEYKYKDGFDFLPYARLIFSANHPPRSDDATHAFFRRWVVIPFERTFEESEQIPRRVLDARLADPKELSGVLNKALAVVSEVRKHGITERESMRSAWKEFKSTTDPLSVWLDANTIAQADATVAKQKLLRAYNTTCDAAGRPGVTAKTFTQALRRLRPHIREAQRTVGGRVQWVWLGIGLASPQDGPPSHGSQGSQGSPTCFEFVNPIGGGRGEARSKNNGNKPVNPVNRVKSKDNGREIVTVVVQPEFDQL